MAFTSPYTSVSTPATYKDGSPANDGSQVAANLMDYDNLIADLSDPLETFCTNLNTNIVAAFAKTINTDDDVNNSLGGSLAYTASTLTIASGSVTGTRAHHAIAAESGTTDNLDTLATTNYSAGDVVYLRGDTGDTITVTTSGNFNAQVVLSATIPTAFMLVGSTWYQIQGGGVFAQGIAPSTDSTYDFGSSSVRWANAYVDSLVSTSTGFFGTTANTKMTIGVTIDQAGNDDEAFAIGSTGDVAHGVTDLSETQNYFSITKNEASNGGAQVIGFSDVLRGLTLEGVAASSDNTAKDSSADAPVRIVATKKSGTGRGALGADANALVVQDSGGTLFIVDEDGDLLADGGTSSTNMVTQFDEYHDASWVEDFNTFLGMNDEPDFERMKRLSELKLMGYVSPDKWDEGVRPLWSVTKVVQLHNGAHVQAWMREQVRDTILARLIPGYRRAMESLAQGRNIGSLPELLRA